jgi:M6 family metalloprotease-like protein
MNRRKKFKRVMAMVIAALMILAAFISVLPLFVTAADEGEISYPISGYNPGEKCYDPIPMLVIMINFDADGDGVDANPDGMGYLKVTNKTNDNGTPNITEDDTPNPSYGEQWCHAEEEDWVKNLFADEGRTLNTYYKYMSDGKFWWIPAEETYGTANNGVIAVTIKNVHPNCNGVSGNWMHCFKQIIEAASEYVDFSKFDVNKNGILEKYELCLALVLGGEETSSGATGIRDPYGFHAYYKDVDMSNLLVTDGVEVGRSGFFGTGALSNGKPLKFGVFAHELGHYLGAPDLYDTAGTAYDNAVGAVSLMASGAHGDAPSHIDPYLLAEFGFVAPEIIMADGEYTLYSRGNSENKYNVIKICTPNPQEYYLIENRYSSVSQGPGFDSGISRGIFIWHIDESFRSNGGSNASGQGHDPTVVTYPLTRADGKEESVLVNYGAFSSEKPAFEVAKYTFPISQTWYTSKGAKGEAVAEAMKDLRIEVLSTIGDEMKIKITGSYKPEFPPDFTLSATDWTKTSVKITATLKTLNYSTLTSAKFIFSERDSGTVVKEQDITLNSNYQFTTDITGLKPNTAYVYKVVGESSHGQFEVKDSNFTMPEEVPQAKVTLVINSDQYKTTVQTVTVGNKIRANFQLKKSKCKFAGWYLDEAYTQPFDIESTITSTPPSRT